MAFIKSLRPFCAGLHARPGAHVMQNDRRDFLKLGASIVASAAALTRGTQLALAQQKAAEESSAALIIDPKPLFDLSPHLYMQFMEPLGITDSSVEACWSYDGDNWRKDFIDTSKDLAPDVMRYGGLFSRYYKWREGVGPADQRPLMRNYIWGGKETNRVGTHEFTDYCRRINAEPMYCVNFMSDGRLFYSKMAEGNRLGDSAEAADWVSYCNDPDNKDRKAHGHPDPYNIKLWQIGNETSYGTGGFTLDQSIEHTIEFATAMRQRDKSIKLIGWGDDGPGVKGEPWAGRLADRAGEHLDYVAFHMMQQAPIRKDTVLNSLKYQSAPERAWEELMEMSPRVEQKIRRFEQVLDAHNSKLPIAVTEGHLSLKPGNANPLLAEWLTGVYVARSMNAYQRHSDRVKIATAADFCGTRWTTNALMLQVPGGISYLLPAGAVMRLFKRHNGKQAVALNSAPTSLDLAASRTGNKYFLHVANTDYARSIETTLAIQGQAITAVKIHEISPEDPRQAASPLEPDALKPREQTLPPSEIYKHRFPARSVTAVELTCAPA
jgi:alpha-L-arabinofuranosidase